MIKPALRKKYRIVVIRGGRSNEREISLQSGENIEKALRSRGHHVVAMDLDDRLFRLLLRKEADMAFIALHGKWGEDGTLQGLLEMLQVPYNGSGVLASALAMDKLMSKRIFRDAGLPTPKWQELHFQDGKPASPVPAEFPLMVKPASGGSTVGVSKVENETSFPSAVQIALKEDGRVFTEEYIEGKEFTVGILGKNKPFALPVAEIRSPGLFDYRRKYTPGQAEHLIPAPVDPDLYKEAQSLALRAHLALGCKGYSRVDLRCDKQNRLYVLEVNTLPGFTSLSIYPDQARAAGIPFEDLVELFIQWTVE